MRVRSKVRFLECWLEPCSWLVTGCSGKETLIDRESFSIEADEVDDFEAARVNVGSHSVDGDACGALGRKTVDAGADGREGDGASLVFAGEREATSITTGQQLVFIVAPAMPDRADGVKDPLGRKAVTGSRLGVAGRAAVQLFTGRQQIGPSSAVYGAVDSATTEEGSIRRVDNGVDGKLCDVTLRRNQINQTPVLALRNREYNFPRQ